MANARLSCLGTLVSRLVRDDTNVMAALGVLALSVSAFLPRGGGIWLTVLHIALILISLPLVTWFVFATLWLLAHMICYVSRACTEFGRRTFQR